jgi:putative transport protein
MGDLAALFALDGVARSVLILSLVAAVGLGFGHLRLGGIYIGLAGVLFSGLVFGHFGVMIPDPILEFAREFGLILFVYAVGTQVGPGFFSSLRRDGLPLNLLAGLVVLLGVAITVALNRWGGVEAGAAAGIFSGATTNTPSLGAAQQALQDLPGFRPEDAALPGLGYAVAYPFGVVGIIVVMLVTKAVFRIDPRKETREFLRRSGAEQEPLATMNIEVRNANLDGVLLGQVPSLAESGVAVSRLRHAGRLDVAHPDTPLAIGDVLLAVGPQDKLEQLRIVVGRVSDVDLRDVPSALMARRVVVTAKSLLGKSVQEIDFQRRFGVAVTRVSRSEVEFTAVSSLRLAFGDRLLLVGPEEALAHAATELGDSPQQLNLPKLIPVFVGIALGVLIGAWPFYLHGVPAPVRLGVAGGPLVMAILLSRVGRIGPLVWYMPTSANLMLREIGITLFLSCVGLKAGGRFVESLVQGNGLYWMACGVAVTAVPLFAAAAVGRLFLKLDFTSLCGVLAGSMTDPPALAYANTLTGSDAPSITYSTVYPLSMILRVLFAQVMVLMLLK